jgi:hypothetical protein
MEKVSMIIKSNLNDADTNVRIDSEKVFQKFISTTIK